jgi:hypothetical protein
LVILSHHPVVEHAVNVRASPLKDVGEVLLADPELLGELGLGRPAADQPVEHVD